MLTALEFTLLALIADGPLTRTALDRQLAARGMNGWLRIGRSSVTHALGRLSRGQLIAEAPAYTVTEAGYGVLQTAVADLLSEPAAVGERFGLALAHLDVLRPARVFTVLQSRASALQVQIERLEAQLSDPQADAASQPMVSHALAIATADRDWVLSFLNDWEARYPAVSEASAVADGGQPATHAHRATDDLNPAKRIQRIERRPPLA